MQRPDVKANSQGWRHTRAEYWTSGPCPRRSASCMETEPAQKHSRNSQAPEHGPERVTRSPFATPAGCGRDAQEPIAQEITMKNLFSIATIIVLGFAATGVANADPQSPQTLIVQFGDLNLDNAQGVDAL